MDDELEETHDEGTLAPRARLRLRTRVRLNRRAADVSIHTPTVVGATVAAPDN